MVLDIGWYRTTIRSYEREVFVIPNAVFSKNIVLNITRKNREWRFFEQICIRVQDVHKVGWARGHVHKSPACRWWWGGGYQSWWGGGEQSWLLLLQVLLGSCNLALWASLGQCCLCPVSQSPPTVAAWSTAAQYVPVGQAGPRTYTHCVCCFLAHFTSPNTRTSPPSPSSPPRLQFYCSWVRLHLLDKHECNPPPSTTSLTNQECNPPPPPSSSPASGQRHHPGHPAHCAQRPAHHHQAAPPHLPGQGHTRRLPHLRLLLRR